MEKNHKCSNEIRSTGRPWHQVVIKLGGRPSIGSCRFVSMVALGHFECALSLRLADLSVDPVAGPYFPGQFTQLSHSSGDTTRRRRDRANSISGIGWASRELRRGYHLGSFVRCPNVPTRRGKYGRVLKVILPAGLYIDSNRGVSPLMGYLKELHHDTTPCDKGNGSSKMLTKQT